MALCRSADVAAYLEEQVAKLKDGGRMWLAVDLVNSEFDGAMNAAAWFKERGVVLRMDMEHSGVVPVLVEGGAA